jgi:AmmeMemoRadiSam system protein B
MDTGEWEIPSGVVKVDRKLASRILLNATGVRDSRPISLSIPEVQLPFMTFLSKEVSIVPISIRSASFNECMALAEAIAHVVKGIDYPVTILASSDMSHYLSDKQRV